MPKDHLVPKTYLVNFANPDQKIYLRNPIKSGMQHIKSATVISNYYSNPDSPSLEEELSKVESRATSTMRKLVVNPNAPLTTAEDQWLFDFVVAMSFRSSRARRLVRDMAKVFKITDFVEVMTSSGPVARHRESLDKADHVIADYQHGDPENELDPLIKDMHHKSFVRMLSKSKEIRRNFEIRLVVFKRKRLITCDSPVVLFSNTVSHVGIANADQIYLPLSPSIAVFYSNILNQSEMLEVFPSTALQMELNSAIARQARKCLMSHENESEIVDSCVPDWNQSELDVPAVLEQMGY